MARVDGVRVLGGFKKALDLLGEIETAYAAAREGDDSTFGQAMQMEICAVLTLVGERPWIGASDDVTEVYRTLGASLLVRLMQTMRAGAEQQAQLTGVIREIGRVQ